MASPASFRQERRRGKGSTKLEACDSSIEPRAVFMSQFNCQGSAGVIEQNRTAVSGLTSRCLTIRPRSPQKRRGAGHSARPLSKGRCAAEMLTLWRPRAPERRYRSASGDRKSRGATILRLRLSCSTNVAVRVASSPSYAEPCIKVKQSAINFRCRSGFAHELSSRRCARCG